MPTPLKFHGRSRPIDGGADITSYEIQVRIGDNIFDDHDGEQWYDACDLRNSLQGDEDDATGNYPDYQPGGEAALHTSTTA